LATLIGDQLWHVAEGRPVRIVSAPYKYLPTASHGVAGYLWQQLSKQAISLDLEPPVLLPFHKARTGSSAYARSSEAERLATLATLGLHLDEKLVRGAVVLVVDDIRITGSAERATAAYLETLAPHSLWYLHAARLDNAVACSHPGLEDELNQSVPHTLMGIIHDVREGNFQLNTRVLRLILETDNKEDYSFFLEVAPLLLLAEMHNAAIGSGLHYVKQYRAAIDGISDELARRYAAA
jgi:hypothetical protein